MRRREGGKTRKRELPENQGEGRGRKGASGAKEEGKRKEKRASEN